MQIPAATEGERHIALPGSYNIRDLGGYAAAGGRQTRWRAVLRADSLHGLDADAQGALIGYGVGCVIDLRRPEECERQPNVFAASPAVRYHNIPLLPGTLAAPAGLPDLEALYRHVLDGAQPQLRAALTAVAQASGGALIHCTAGKDRTGIVAALLLALADVPDETVIADYALTGAHIGPLLERLRAEAARVGHASAQFERMLECRPEAMAATLGYLKARYGGARRYAELIGVGQAEISALRGRMLA